VSCSLVGASAASPTGSRELPVFFLCYNMGFYPEVLAGGIQKRPIPTVLKSGSLASPKLPESSVHLISMGFWFSYLTSGVLITLKTSSVLKFLDSS
jgi:hypothetical protein